MATIGYTLALIAALCAAAALAAVAYWTRYNIIPALYTIAERSGNGPGDQTELERKLAALARRVEDVDEASEHRYRKLAARDRRAAAKPATGEDDDDQLDITDFVPAVNRAAPNGRRRTLRPAR